MTGGRAWVAAAILSALNVALAPSAAASSPDLQTSARSGGRRVAPEVRYAPGLLLVTYRRHVSSHTRELIDGRAGASVRRTISALRAETVAIEPDRLRAAAAVYASNPDVSRVERDPIATLAHGSCVGNPACVVPNDPLFRRQWGLQNDESTMQPDGSTGTPGADIDAPLAWGITTGSSSTLIAVVDTGIDATHPDLAGRVVDQTTVNSGTDQLDHAGHGTVVAGAAAAIPNNHEGLAGVAYRASLMDVKVRDDASQSTTCDSIADGIVYATDNGANVINVSLGSGAGCSPLEDAAAYAWAHGALIVAAAGNGAGDYPVYPAVYAHVIAVGATDNQDRRASFSEYGSYFVDLAAPGVRIITTFPTYANDSGVEDYGYDSGTSLSAPLVAGAAALIWPTVADANGDGFVNDDVAERLFTTADPIEGTGTDWQYGRPDVCRAATAGADRCPVPTPATPVSAVPPLVTTTPLATPTSTPLRITRRAALRHARAALSKRFGRRFTRGSARRLRCTISSLTSAVCRVRWTRGGTRYRGMVRLTARLVGGRTRWHATVRVRRAALR
jgi:thermitase